MSRVNCVLIEDNVIEFLEEVQEQMSKKLVCCKCPNPCGGDGSRCAIAMKNLLTDIHMFLDSYKKQNDIQEVEKEEEQENEEV
jgi:hypothetical protein